MNSCLIPKPAKYKVNRLGKSLEGLPIRRNSLSVHTLSGRVCHSVKPARSTWRNSATSSLRHRFWVFPEKACLSIGAAPNGSRILQMIATSPLVSSIPSWLSSCQISCTAVAFDPFPGAGGRGGGRGEHLGHSLL